MVASTSSEAIIPELDFVFKKPSSSSKYKGRFNGTNTEAHNRFQPNDQSLNDDYADPTSEEIDNRDSIKNRTPKYDDEITAIVDDNGSIHIGPDDSVTSPLLHLLGSIGSSSSKIKNNGNGNNPLIIPFNGKNSLPGTAASNRNTASQQLILTKNLPSSQMNEASKVSSYLSSSSSGVDPLSEIEKENLDIKTLKSGSGTILVFNRTQLITIAGDQSSLPDTATTKGGNGNSSSTFILIDHQQPKVADAGQRQSLLPEFDLTTMNGNGNNNNNNHHHHKYHQHNNHHNQQQNNHHNHQRLNDRPRQVCLVFFYFL